MKTMDNNEVTRLESIADLHMQKAAAIKTYLCGEPIEVLNDCLGKWLLVPTDEEPILENPYAWYRPVKINKIS